MVNGVCIFWAGLSEILEKWSENDWFCGFRYRRCSEIAIAALDKKQSSYQLTMVYLY
jgi:hypothetical protein